MKRSATATALYGSLGPSGAAVLAMAAMLAAGNGVAYTGGAMLNSNSKTETHTGQITVFASDPRDGANTGQDMRSEMAANGQIANASYGMK
ncbi:hypothetical protein SAMN05444172_9054 [Burkholderia sp. GAS332]|nr:hypothetical protein SAMN05444172_9054 [Burkholderia sp. GAS332]